MAALQLPSYGFEVNGTYRISIISENTIKGKLFFHHKKDKIASIGELQSICQNDYPQISDLNFTENGVQKSIVFSGEIPDKNVYYPLFIYCGDLDSEYKFNIEYENKVLKVDFREILTKPLINFFSKLFFCIHVLWIINGFRYSGFRIRLHTIFTFLPLFRVICLYFSKNKENESMESYLFHVVYYTINLYTILAVGRGWCTFMYHLPLKYIFNSLFSSFILVIGIIGSSISYDLSTVFISICFIGIGLISYLRIFIINIVLLTRLQNQMIKQPILISKIKLSKEFALKCFCLFVFQTIINAFSLLFDLNSYYRILSFEIFMIIISYQQMKYFMFKDEYIGKTDTQERDLISKRSFRYQVKLISEPKSKNLVIFE